MSAPPQVITRSLTFKFSKSVSALTGLPDIMEVAILPLEDASVGGQATFAGGLKTVTVELSDAVNTATFNLIPTDSPGLTARIQYRAMWRAGITGRTSTVDFAMPDEDLDWDELVAGIGNVIGGETYLQQSDLGVPGRVARLDDEGRVIDAFGIPVATGDDISGVENDINVEIIDRGHAVAGLRTILENELTAQVNATLTSAQQYTNTKAATLTGALGAETSLRISGDALVQHHLDTASTHFQDEIDSLAATTGGTTTALDFKANLVDGVIPIDEIPAEVYTNVFPVPNEAAMLALTYPTTARGDLCIRPDSIWLLATNDPSQLSNWLSLSIINSVNGQHGVVVLNANDVGAIPVGGSVSKDQVTGLNTALLNKTETSVSAAMQAQINSILADPTVVRTVAGLIAGSVMPANIALVNTSGQVTDKSGNIVASGGGGGAVASVNGHIGVVSLGPADVGAIALGAVLPQSQVTNLPADLAARVLSSDARLTNARTPTAHATSHGVGQTDPITLAQSQITGLPGIVSNNALTSSSNAVNRIGGLEGRVTTLEGGGGGGGGGISTTSVFFDSATVDTDVTDFSQVVLHTPWGLDSDGTITGTPGIPYYLHSGVRSQDVAFPHITANGHLHLYRWNEAGAADPVYALNSDLNAVSATVTTKANTSDLAALSATVDTKAAAADLSALTTVVATKATQTALNTTNAAVGTKANQTDLDTLSATVGTKAATSALATTNTNVSALQAAMPAKADLSGGKLLLTETPQNIPIGYISGLGAYLAHLNSTTGTFDAAYLTNLGNIPASIPASAITGLPAVLTNKADLVGGLIPTSQMPPLSLNTSVPVANRAALLALMTSQVQPGDLGIITSTVDKGTYMLMSADPSQFGNWQLLNTPDAPVASINGLTGTVVLSYSDVGALAVNAALPISQTINLQATLDLKATTAAMTTGLGGKTSPSDVQNLLYTSGLVKYADYVATSAVSQAGRQSVDGILVPISAVVLCTAQASSVNNGLWIVNAGAWTRPANFATGSWLAKDTMTVIFNSSSGADGVANTNTIWRMTASGGSIDTAANSWSRFGWTSPPLAKVDGNGIAITGTYPNLTFSAKTVSGGGVLAASGGLSIDRNLTPGKFLGTVPSGSTVAGVTHNLNTNSPAVFIYDTASGNLVLAGITVTSSNAISIEFASAPATGQYRVACYG